MKVNKANTVAATVTANSRTYDGTEKPLVTVTGEPTGGEMQYALGENATTAPSDNLYNTSIPTAINAGTYYVWYMVQGDDNHNDSNPQCTAVAIIKANVAPTVPDESALVYNGQAQALLTKGSVTGGTLEYALGTSATSAPTSGWSTTVPTAKDAGTYYAWYRVVGDANHNDVAPVCVTVTLEKRPLTITAEAKSKVYGQSDPALTYKVDGLVSGDSLTGALKRAAGEYAGNYTIEQGTLAASDNYALTYNAARFTITKADQGSVPASSVTTSDASSESANDGAISGVSAGMEYSPDDGETWIPIGGTTVNGLRMGDYLVGQSGDENHNPSAAVKVTVSGTSADKSAILITTLVSSGDTGLTATWNAVKGVDGYDLYFKRCNGKGNMPLVATVEGGNATSYTFTGLAKHKSYKVYVRAWIKKNGGKQYVASRSPIAHAYTGNGSSKYANPGTLTLKTPSMTVKLGKTKNITATVKGVKKGSLAHHVSKLRYISSDTSVATVTSKGKVKAVGAGSCQIYVLTTNGIWKTVTVTVDARPTKVSVSKPSKTMKVGATQNLGAKVKLTPKKAVTTLSWKSSNPDVATVDANGVVTAIKKGKTVITVTTANGKKAKVTIKVK